MAAVPEDEKVDDAKAPADDDDVPDDETSLW